MYNVGYTTLSNIACTHPVDKKLWLCCNFLKHKSAYTVQFDIKIKLSDNIFIIKGFPV